MSPSFLSYRCTLITATLLATLTPSGATLAQDVEIAVHGLGGASASPLATLTRLGVALAFVLLAFWGCARLMRRLQRANEAGGGGLRIVGGLSLGQRERLVVVQAGSEQLLLGVGIGRIERLHILDTPLGSADEHSDSTVQTIGEPADFRAKLLAAMQSRVPS